MADTYGGSYASRTSFNSRQPKLPRNASVNTPINLGILDPGVKTISGLVGSRTGAATLFWRFETGDTYRIALSLNAINRHTDDELDINLVRTDGKGRLADDGQFKLRNDSGSHQRGEAVLAVPPGEFILSVSANSWHQLPFSFSLQITSSALLAEDATFGLNLMARFNQSQVAPSLTGRLLVLARIAKEHKLGSAPNYGYTDPDYWDDGYTDDPEPSGRPVGPRIQLQLRVSLAVISPPTI